MNLQLFITRIKHACIVFFLWIILLSGIGRDDVLIKKYFDFAMDSTFDCIGEVYNKKGKFILSCVLIDNNHILSSAHGFYMESKESVVDTITVLNKRYPIKRAKYSTLLDKSQFYFKFKDKIFYAKRIIIHPEYNDDFHSDGYNDIAIIELTESVDSVKAAILYTDTSEINSRAVICGFGNNSNAIEKKTSRRRKKMAGENIIDSIGGNKVNSTYGVLFADMDNPRSIECNRMGSSTPLPLEWHGDAGDCGGGLFIQQDNKWRLAGISFAPSYFADWKVYGEKYGIYGFIDGWTRISPLVDWIAENTK